MREKKIKSVVLLLAVMMLLGGCSGSSSSDSAGSDKGEAAYTQAVDENSLADSDTGVGEEEDGNASQGTAQKTAADRKKLAAKIIYQGDADLSTVHFEKTVEHVRRLAEQYGAYVAGEEQYENGTSSTGEKSRNMEMTLRIPAEHFRDFVDALEKGEASDSYVISHKSIHAQDISKAYYDTAGRLDSAKRKLESLQELYKRATAMQDIIQIQGAINDCQQEIDSLQGTLSGYDDQVAYSTLSLSIDEDTALTAEGRSAASYGSRLLEAFKSGFYSGLDFIGNILLFIAHSWFVLLIIALIIFCLVRIIIAADRRARIRRAKKQQAMWQNRQDPQNLQNPNDQRSSQK